MNLEDLLRETLAGMADEEPPPHPNRFLPPLRTRRVHRRGAALTAAGAVVALSLGAAMTVRTLSETNLPVPPAAARPEPAKNRVTVKEGLRLDTLLDLLARTTGKRVASFAQASDDGRALGLPAYARGRLEGFAYPGTYEYTSSSTPTEILTAMVTRFGESAAKLGLDAQRAPLDVVIIASLIQAEAPSEADMPKMARVIHNRLARGMKLQLTSTVLYGLSKYGITATSKDTKSETPYNTFRYRGLPPGPIANPGEAALKAALHPASGPWLYWVVTDPERGTVKYAASQAEAADLLEHSRLRAPARR